MGNYGKFYLWKRGFRQIAGLSFSAAVLAQAGAIYDKVIFIDIKRGADGNDGSDWAHAVNSINGACDLCYGGDTTTETLARGRGGFLFVYRSYQTGGDTYATQQTIDVNGVHLVGAGQFYGSGAMYDSSFQVNGNNLTADAELSGLPSAYAGLLVKADDVQVIGMKFVLRDATHNPFMVAFSDQHPADDGTHGRAGHGVALINCELQGDSGGSGTHYGVGISGCEAFRLAGNHYRYLTTAIVPASGPIRYANAGIVKDEVITGCGNGIKPSNAELVDTLFDNITIQQKGQYGVTFVKGIDMTLGVQNWFRFCHVNHATKGTAYVPGTNNYFHRCFYGGTGAVATEYDGT